MQSPRAVVELEAPGGDRIDSIRVTLEAALAAEWSGRAHLDIGTLGRRHPLASSGAQAGTDSLTVPIRVLERAVVIGSPWQSGRPGPCPGCLDRRWLATRSDRQRDLLAGRGEALEFSTFPHLTGFGLDALAALLGAMPLQAPDGNTGEVVHLDLADLSVTRHGLVKDSECACSVPEADRPENARLALKPCPKPDPNVLRLRRPADIDLPLSALANPVCGMLGAAGLPDHSPTATAPVTGFFTARGIFGFFPVWWSGHGEAYDKSESLALLEGIERYAGQFPRARSIAIAAPAADLHVPFLDPSDFPRYPEAFYTQNHGHYVRWSPDLPVNWVWGYSLRDNAPLLVPEQVAYYLLRPGSGPYFTQECSNGCASGSSIEEAILHGLLEVVERDAFLLSWYGRRAVPEIAMSSIAEPITRAMAARIDRLGWDLRCFDMRVDLADIPVVGAVAIRREGGYGGLSYAAGCSLDPEDAVRAAVCEVASYVPNLEKRGRADEMHAHEMAADFTQVRLLEDHTLLHSVAEMRPFSAFLLERSSPAQDLGDLFPDSRSRGRLDLRDDVLAVAAAIMALGSDVIVVDQTPPEQAALGLRTVKMIAPGLVPIDFGWDKQRVLQSERLHRFVTERGVNPAPHPFP